MAETTTSKNKRILKNTMVLYIRMIFVLILSLYSARFILRALGVEDYGLYNVVGGVVGMMTFFKTTMAKATQRFLNVTMVEDKDSLTKIFSSSITVHLIISIVFLLLCETVGLWFLNNHVMIPEGRELSANIVFQTTVISICVSLMSIPYTAAIIAFEKMTFVAVVNILDALLILGLSLFLLYSSGDRLVFYGVCMLLITILNLLFNLLYCRRKYNMLHFQLSFHRNGITQIFSFVGWTLMGQFAIVACNQGNIVLVNMFHSVTANAAMSIGNQVNHAITNLTSNFQTAFNPQITKSYAEENFSYLKSLTYTTSKISFCILFVIALPVSYNIDIILDVWLGEVPKYSNIFSILFLVNGILNALSSPFNFIVLSSKNIRLFQIVISVIFLFDLPIAYLLFSYGLPPTTILWVKISIMSIICWVRFYFASRLVPSIELTSFLFKELIPLFSAAAIPMAMAYLLYDAGNDLVTRFLYTVMITSCFIILVWKFCMSKKEREQLLKYAKIKRV